MSTDMLRRLTNRRFIIIIIIKQNASQKSSGDKNKEVGGKV